MKTKKRQFSESKILELRQSGKTYKQIAEIVGCHWNTVRLYLKPEIRNGRGPNTKWIKKNRPRLYQRRTVKKKLYHFQTKGVGIKNRSKFTFDEVKSKFSKSKTCYLTGRPLSWNNPTDLHFDHIIPASRGGSNEISNLGFACKDANLAKRDKTPEEHIAYCLEVVKNAGYKVKKI